MAPPAGLQFQRNDKLDVLVMRGLWNRLYHIDEARRRWAKAAISTAYTTFHQQQDTQLSGFKLDWQPLFTQDVVVLANIETRGLGLGAGADVGEYVRQGGGLVILGGLRRWARPATCSAAGRTFSRWSSMPRGKSACDPPVRFANPRKPRRWPA